MSISNYLGSNILSVYINDAALITLGTDLYLALHTASPGAAGNQTTSEATYTGYARLAIPRDGSDISVSDLVATFLADKDFPKATGGTESLTHASIGTDASGAGNVLVYDEIQGSGGAPSPISVTMDTIPRIEAGTTLTLS